jgi:hypothetical protein
MVMLLVGRMESVPANHLLLLTNFGLGRLYLSQIVEGRRRTPCGFLFHVLLGHAAKGETLMYPVWKNQQLNKLYRRERLEEANHERLVRLALQNSAPRNVLRAMLDKLAAFRRNLRMVAHREMPGVYDEGKVVVEYD